MLGFRFSIIVQTRMVRFGSVCAGLGHENAHGVCERVALKHNIISRFQKIKTSRTATSRSQRHELSRCNPNKSCPKQPSVNGESITARPCLQEENWENGEVYLFTGVKTGSGRRILSPGRAFLRSRSGLAARMALMGIPKRNDTLAILSPMISV